MDPSPLTNKPNPPLFTLQEIENTCLMFSYSSNPGPEIQSKLNEIFRTNHIDNKYDLYQQLKMVIWLLQQSKRDIVHQITQSHLKTILSLKHSLFSPKELQDLRDTLDASFDAAFYNSNRLLLNSFIQIQAIISVLGWVDVEAFPQRYLDLLKDAESPTPSPYSLPSIVAIVKEMNPDTSVIKNFGKHRKAAVQFRDSHLKPLLQSAFWFFLQTLPQPNSTTETALSVISACLSFDFLGTMADQDSHGMTSAVQIPASLKSWVIEEKPLDHLMEGFDTYPSSKHDKLIETMSWLFGCRRSLFLEEERIPFFERACAIVTRLCNIPFDEDAEMEFLKLLLRFTSVYANDMRKGENAKQMLPALLQYSKIKISNASPTCFLFLLQIWVQLRDSEAPFFVECLESFKELLVMFVNISPSLLETLFFDDENSVEQIISPLGKLLRLCSTDFTMRIVVGRLEQYGKNSSELGMTENAWTIGIYANSISHRVAYQAESFDDKNDGITCSAIFNYTTQKQLQTNPRNKFEEQLELSILNYFEQFKHTFLTGDGSSCPEVWQGLANGSQITSQEHVLGLFLQRCLQYLKDQITESLILKSVQVFKELVNGVRTMKLLQTPEIMVYVESSGVLGFNIITTFQKSKCLTVLFENLGRLFMNDVYQNQPEANLLKLLDPISLYLQDFEQSRNDGTQMDLVVRKLRGILASIYSSKLFKIFFEWIRPHFRAFAVFLDSPSLCVNGPVNTLKLFRDLICNKVNRLVFDSAIEVGILVFRETMTIVLPIVMKLESVLSQPNLPENIWVQQCLKPITILLDTFKNSINSRAVPFGVLELYQDPSLNEMIQSVYLISSFIRPEQVLQYTKLGASFFNLWVCMTSDFMPYLMARMDEGLFSQIALNTYHILQNLDNNTSSQACTFVSAVYTEMNSTKRLYGVNPGDFHKSLIPLILHRLLGSDVYIETQWSFTRPLFPLVLFDLDWFQRYLNHLVQSQPQESQEGLQKVLFGIMNGIEDNYLSSKNRDRFTSNVESVKRNLRSDNLVIDFGSLVFAI